MTTHFRAITVKEFSAPGWNTAYHAEVWTPNCAVPVRQPRAHDYEAHADAMAVVNLPLTATDVRTFPWRGGTQTITTYVPRVDLVCEARYEREGWTITVALMRDAKGMWLVGEFGNDRETVHDRSRETRRTSPVDMFATEEEARAAARVRHYAIRSAGYVLRAPVLAV